MVLSAHERMTERSAVERKLEDHRAGIIAAAVYTAMGVTADGKKKWSPVDFFASLKEEQKEDEVLAAEHSAAMASWVTMFGGHQRATA